MPNDGSFDKNEPNVPDLLDLQQVNFDKIRKNNELHHIRRVNFSRDIQLLRNPDIATYVSSLNRYLYEYTDVSNGVKRIDNLNNYELNYIFNEFESNEAYKEMQTLYGRSSNNIFKDLKDVKKI